MNRLTPLLLLTAVAVVAVLVVQQAQRESATRFHSSEPLLGQLNLDDVFEIHVEHVERDEFLTLSREEGERWWIREPIDFPAAAAGVKLILDGLKVDAEFVAESERESVTRGLSRPRARVELVERTADGDRRVHEILLGDLDVDGMRVLCGTRGECFRILRNLDTALKRSVLDLRDPFVFGIDPTSVVAFERERTAEGDLLPRELDLRAERLQGEWIALSPTRVRLDAYVTLLWLRAACRLEAVSFPWDPPTDPEVFDMRPPLERWGLDRPRLRFKVTTSSGRTHTLVFGYPDPPVGWFGQVEGDEHVYGFTNEAVTRLAQPWQDLVDDHLLRVFRDDVRALVLDRRGDRLRIEQGRGGRWTLAHAAPGEETFRDLGALDPRRLDALFGALDTKPVLRWLPMLDGRLPGEGVRVSVRAELQGMFEGITRGFELGDVLAPEDLLEPGPVGPLPLPPELTDPLSGEALELCAVLRPGDELVGAVDHELLELLEEPAAAWRSPELWDLQEIHQTRLTLEGDGVRRVYERRPQGTWAAEGGEALARELLPLLDHLVFLRGERWLDPHEVAALPDELGSSVRVTFRDGSRGDEASVILGTGPDGAVLVRSGGQVARLERQALHGELLDLLHGR